MWISINEILPAENETVWCFSEKQNTVFLGSCVYINKEGWFWAISNGIVYAEDGKIVAECEIDDLELDVTHWHSLPELPTKK